VISLSLQYATASFTAYFTIISYHLVDPKLDYDVWSCRKDKGLHQALIRTKNLTTKYGHGWVWRADISKFFDNVDHQTLRKPESWINSHLVT